MTDREAGLLEQGGKLREWRVTQRGESGRVLSQAGAAKRVGASQGAWAAWEKGRKAPDSFFADRLETLTSGPLVVLAKGWAFRRGPARVSPASSNAA